MKELRREKKNIILIYSVQAQFLMSQLRNFNIEEFEKNFANEVVIGDKVISKYILEKEAKRIGQETKDGSKRK